MKQKERKKEEKLYIRKERNVNRGNSKTNAWKEIRVGGPLLLVSRSLTHSIRKGGLLLLNIYKHINIGSCFLVPLIFAR